METIKTKNPKFTIRFATPENAGLVVEFMRKLGIYQKMLDKTTATEEEIHKILSKKKEKLSLEIMMAFKFYKELGAYSVDIMTIYRLAPDKLKENADQF